jgi:mannose-6-phosphate isomerase-like protein (cupin superfamily)
MGAHTLDHVRVYRPWGWYQALNRGNRYQVKCIMVKPGGTLSLQSHFHRSEHWVVVEGTLEVTKGDKIELLSENQSTYFRSGRSIASQILARSQPFSSRSNPEAISTRTIF